MDTIEKLQSLYQQLDKDLLAGEDVVAELRREINNLELAYLKNEVMPYIVNILGSKVKNLRCELDCSIQYNDEKQLNYTFCTSGSTLLIKDSVAVTECKDNTAQQIRKNGTVVAEQVLLNSSQKTEPIPLRIVDYSERAFAVYGVSQHLSKLFKEKGGYFNRYLKDGPGWIFPKKKRDEIGKLIEQVEENHAQFNSNEKVEAVEVIKKTTESACNLLSEKDWLKRFANLRCKTYKGLKSPHKAIYILALIDCIQSNIFRDTKIRPLPQFVLSFHILWKRYIPNNCPFIPNFYQPYIHLSGESFYDLVKQNESEDFNLNQSWTELQADRLVEYCIIDSDLFNMLKDTSFTNKVKAVLIENYLNQSWESAQTRNGKCEDREIINFSEHPSMYANDSTETNKDRRIVCRDSEMIADSNRQSNQIEIITKDKVIEHNRSSRSNLVGFKSYLFYTRSKSGTPYPAATISDYIISLRSKYIQSLIDSKTSDGLLESLEIHQLELIKAVVDRDAEKGEVSNTIAEAFGIYVDFRKSSSPVLKA